MNSRLRSIPFIVALAICWILATGQIGWGNAVAGLCVGAACNAIGRERPHRKRGRAHPWVALRLLAVVALRIAQASFELILEVVRPRPKLKPSIIAVPLKVQEGYPTLLFANLISLTPGSLSLALDEQQRVLFVHSLTGQSPEAIVRQLKRDFEEPIRLIFGT